jgi:hypothetical protein
MHGTDGVVLIMFACICVTIERVGLAATVGGLGVWLLLR